MQNGCWSNMLSGPASIVILYIQEIFPQVYSNTDSVRRGKTEIRCPKSGGSHDEYGEQSISIYNRYGDSLPI